jgi:probable selenium-dependent hydroxylase accessory protein YqeC
MTGVHFLPSPGNSAFIARCVGAGLPSVVSLVGAGGKTSTLFWLARALAAGGQRVLVTTTTRMFPPEPKYGRNAADRARARDSAWQPCEVCPVRRVSWRCSAISMHPKAR